MKIHEPKFTELVLTTSEGKQFVVITEDEVDRRVKAALWLRTIIVVNLLITGFMVGFAVAYYIANPKIFLGVD